MKRISIAVLLFIVVSGAVLAEGKLTRVGYVDMDVILRSLAKDRAMFFALRGLVDRSAQRIAELEKEIAELQQKLQMEEEELSDKEERKITDEIAMKSEELERRQREEVLKKMSAADVPSNVPIEVKKSIYLAIKRVARRESYSMVLDRYISGVLYVDSEIDITQKVIAELRVIAEKKADELSDE
jgi:Skp family chaperone for outer membrane proteins